MVVLAPDRVGSANVDARVAGATQVFDDVVVVQVPEIIRVGAHFWVLSHHTRALLRGTEAATHIRAGQQQLLHRKKMLLGEMKADNTIIVVPLHPVSSVRYLPAGGDTSVSGSSWQRWS